MRFEFASADRIVFGEGTAGEIPSAAARLGRRAVVITGSGTVRAPGLLDGLKSEGIETQTVEAVGEPTVDTVNRITSAAREFDADLAIAVGGGSVIDTGKAVAAMLTNPGAVEDYLEVVGQGKPLIEWPMPCIAVPTTAGTGAEVTRNSVLGVPGEGVKVSMRSPLMLPDLAVIDPELTYDMPPELTASTGLDALTQLLEAFVSHEANPLTDGICREGLAHAVRALPQVYRRSGDKQARREMALASLFGGLALANARLGAVHGFAGPLGGMIEAPHGAICARLLPFVTKTNISALAERAPESAALERYREIARLATGEPDAEEEQLVEWLEELTTEMRTQGLSRWGLKPEMLPDAVTRAQRASSMKGNPLELSERELTEILERAL